MYKFLGADRQIKKMFAAYQIFQCLIKFDVFFWVGFCVQIAWLVLDSHSLEFYITCAALVLSIVLLVEGHLAARYENKWMMISFLSGCVTAMVYFCYKVWLPRHCLSHSHFGLLIQFTKIIIHKNTPEFSHVWESLSTFGQCRVPSSSFCASDVVAAVIAIMLLIMTFIYAWMVMRNFGRGLKDQSMSTLRPFQHPCN